MPTQAYRVPHPAASQQQQQQQIMRPPSRPVSTIPNADDSSVVPGGTNVISGYDPATVRAMNLSRAENLLSQKHQKFYPPPPVPSSHSSQVKYLFSYVLNFSEKKFLTFPDFSYVVFFHYFSEN